MIARRLQLTMIVVAALALGGLGAWDLLKGDDSVVAATAPSTTMPTTTAPQLTTVPPRAIAVEGLASATTAAPAATVAPTVAPASVAATTTAPAPGGKGIPLDPSWPKELFVLSDSVVLSGKAAIPARFPDWRVEIDGKPALMLKAANERLRARGKPVGSVAVMAIGYNSLWEKDRRNYDRWAERFDQEAEALLETLSSLGAKKVVWVTLREPTPDTVPPKAVKELSQYSWYFPYVNERLRALAERHPEVALADWTSVSNRNGITYDSIHLNETGAKLMADVIAEAVGVPPAA